MNKLKANLKWILIIVLPLAIIITTFIYSTEDSVTGKKTVQQDRTHDGGKLLILEEKKSTIENEFPLDMSESGVQYAIHHMSHQKVVADKKWGAIPLTAERVKRLLEVVQNKRRVYKNGRVYEKILIRWSNNDFSKADEDHNVIWKLQNGDVGRATGLLSSEEEQKFIEKHFKRNR